MSDPSETIQMDTGPASGSIRTMPTAGPLFSANHARILFAATRPDKITLSGEDARLILHACTASHADLLLSPDAGAIREAVTRLRDLLYPR
jgi:hypothetical protein